MSIDEKDDSDLLPSLPDFPDRIVALLATLSASIGIHCEVGQCASRVELVDRALRPIPDALYVPVIAFIGEAVREALGGEWEVWKVPGSDQYLPILVRGNGQLRVAWYLARQVWAFGRNSNSISVRDAVDAACRSGYHQHQAGVRYASMSHELWQQRRQQLLGLTENED